MKKITAVILAALAAASTISAGSYTLGDTDENGIIDGRDATLVLTEYAQTSTGKKETFSDLQNKAADVDENNIIDGRDASWILSYYAYISANGGEMDLRRFVNGEPYERNYSFENIAHDSEVFAHHARELNYELFQGKSIPCAYGLAGGESECRLLLAILNYGQIDEYVLQNTLGVYSENDIKNFQNFLYNLAYAKKNLGSNVDFTKYTLNKEIGEYLNFLEESADNGTIIDVIADAWNNDNMPEECLNHPAPYLALESYDEHYNGNKIIFPGDVNGYILDKTVDDIISRAFGYEYHR